MKDVILQLTAKATEAGFDILAINEGEAKGHGIYFPAQVLLDAMPLYDGLPVFIDHPQPNGKQSIRNLAGTLSAPSWSDAERGIQAILIPSGPSKSVLMEIREAAKDNPAIMQAIGFSSVVGIQLNGKATVTKITYAKSVDVVIDPARGGRFLQEISGAITDSEINAKSVNKQTEGGLKMSKKVKVKVTNAEGVVEEVEGELSNPTAHDIQLEANRQASAELLGETARQTALDAQLAESAQILIEQCEHLLTSGLSTSKLPTIVQDRIRKQFTGRAFKAVELSEAITDAKSEVATLTAGQNISGPSRIGGMQTTADQFELAMLDLMGVDRDDDKKSVKVARLSGIREAYLLATGDREFIGGYFGEFALDAASFPIIIKNAMNKRLAQAWARYGAAGYDWWKHITTVEHFDNVKSVDWAILGTIGALPTVAESAPYNQLSLGDNGETSTWTKYGGYVALTLEDILNDDIRAFKRLPDEAAMGGMRNISEQVAAIFTQASGAGPTLSDTGALFNSTAVTTIGGHANLLTTALGTTYTAWEAASTAMYNQPMHIKNAVGVYGTGKKQAVDAKFCLVPRALRGAANDLFITRQNSADNKNFENLYFGQVYPLTVPEWTDATDWAQVADPNILPGIMLGEIFGLMPQIVVAGKETDGAMFANDESRLKIRQFLTVGIGNWRALSKSNVT